MKTVPSNIYLVRLACKFSISVFPDYIIHLGLDTQEYMNIEHQYAPNGIQSIMFMAMVQWKKNMEVKLIRPSLQHIADALDAVKMNKHFLCQQNIERFGTQESESKISESRLQSPVEDEVLRDLPKHIGNCVIHLGIELGLTVEDIEAAMYNYPKDMYSQIDYILHKWKTTSRAPMVFTLMKALQHVKSGGMSYLCEKYNVCAQDKV
ncbi:unnamed protein product [Mytilus coruscus]|uniref:Death domain-containing protein n=1 Tax=Mytilus coruscus TaxID=42192 RepID=A0A6J8CS50_MYTCO|nr:unnamed protein product [Mytilus coruscus]